MDRETRRETVPGTPGTPPGALVQVPPLFLPSLDKVMDREARRERKGERERQ